MCTATVSIENSEKEGTIIDYWILMFRSQYSISKPAAFYTSKHLIAYREWIQNYSPCWGGIMCTPTQWPHQSLEKLAHVAVNTKRTRTGLRPSYRNFLATWNPPKGRKFRPAYPTSHTEISPKYTTFSYFRWAKNPDPHWESGLRTQIQGQENEEK
jgi:hypothetical protein